MPGKHSTSELPARLVSPYFVRRSSWPGEKTPIKTLIAPAQHAAKTGSGVDGALCWTHAGGMAEAAHPGLDVWLMWLLEEYLYLPACKMVFLSPSLWTFYLKYPFVANLLCFLKLSCVCRRGEVCGGSLFCSQAAQV